MTSVDQGVCPPRYGEPVWVSTGGMGDLYRAVDHVLDRVVAIKLLTQRLASDDEVRQRFRREALAAARLSDEPNTVTIFDVGEWQGRPFIVMEYLGGGTLEQVLRSSGAQPPARALAWVEQAAAALDAAHARGIIHRDIKPANLLLDEHARVRVADFGIATAAGLDSLTLTGTILGTAGYLSPEQAQGHTVTPATDRYALAVVAFELLTGTRPFHRDSVTAEAAAHAYAVIPSATQQSPTLPAAVEAVFERALAKQPADRFSSCKSFAAALRVACGPETDAVTRRLAPVPAAGPPTRVIRRRRRRPGLVAAGALAALLAGGGVTAFLLGADGDPSAAPTVVKTVTRPATATTAKTTTAATTNGAQTSADASDLNTLGYRLILAGNYSAALPLLQRAVAGLTDPTNPVTAYANFNLGQTLVRLGRCGEAMPYLQRALQLEPSSQQVDAAVAYAGQCAGTGATAAAGVPPGHGRPKRHKDHSKGDG